MTENPTHEKLANITAGLPETEIKGDGTVRPMTTAQMMQAVLEYQLCHWERSAMRPRNPTPVNG